MNLKVPDFHAMALEFGWKNGMLNIVGIEAAMIEGYLMAITAFKEEVSELKKELIDERNRINAPQ